MHFNPKIFGLGVRLLAGSVRATQSSLYVTNQCSETVHVVYSNEQYNSASVTLITGKNFEVILSGEGMNRLSPPTKFLLNLCFSPVGFSVGCSTDPNFYSTSVAKLIFGYSVNSDHGLLYNSFTTDYGNPFAGQTFSLTSNNAECTPVISPNGVTYACPDTSSLALALCS